MKWREIVVAGALWTVLFIVLAPESIRNGHDDVREIAFGATLAVVVFAVVKMIGRK